MTTDRYDVCLNDLCVFLNDTMHSEVESYLNFIGGVELDLSENIDAKKLLKPLTDMTSFRNMYQDLESVLSSMIISCVDPEVEYENYDSERVYLCILYLHCYIKHNSNTQDGIMPTVCAVLSRSSSMLERQGQFLVIQYLLSIYFNNSNFGYREDFPLTSIIISLMVMFKNLSFSFGNSIELAFKSEAKMAGINFFEDKELIGTSIREGADLFAKQVEELRGQESELYNNMMKCVWGTSS